MTSASDKRWRRARRAHPVVPFVLMAVAAVAPLVLTAALAPEPLALPALSVASLSAAALMALAAWATGARRDVDGVTAWDVAGAFTLVGCAAAMLTQAEFALEYLIGTREK